MIVKYLLRDVTLDAPKKILLTSSKTQVLRFTDKTHPDPHVSIRPLFTLSDEFSKSRQVPRSNSVPFPPRDFCSFAALDRRFMNMFGEEVIRIIGGERGNGIGGNDVWVCEERVLYSRCWM